MLLVSGESEIPATLAAKTGLLVRLVEATEKHGIEAAVLHLKVAPTVCCTMSISEALIAEMLQTCNTGHNKCELELSARIGNV